jgi:hypothetical protein
MSALTDADRLTDQDSLVRFRQPFEVALVIAVLRETLLGVACQSTLLPSAAPPIRCAIIVGTRPEQSPSPPTESVRGGPSARIAKRATRPGLRRTHGVHSEAYDEMLGWVRNL